MFTKEKIRRVLLLLSITSIFSCSIQQEDKKINVMSDHNIETLTICFEIAEKGFWNFPFDDYQPMKEMAREKFKQYQNHQAIIMIDSLVSRGFWLDAMIEVMLKSSQLPNAELIYDLDQSTINRLSNDSKEALDLVDKFILSMNNFYLEANMSEYFEEQKVYFASVNREVKNSIPDEHFIKTMEKYYGKENDSYTLIPSPSLYHTMGFGKRIKGDIGFKVFNVFGPLIVTKDSTEFGFGFNDPDEIDELTVHEFGHSFINPILELKENISIIDKYEYLFEPIKEDMKDQGYGNWRTCVIEHAVRLGEIRISYYLGDSLRANRIRDNYINDRKFIYLTHLEKEISTYENNRDTYESIDDYLPILLNSLSKIDSYSRH
jgi:hypothetical protein